MAVLRTTLCAVFIVTAVVSKPVSLGEDEDSSKVSESSESSSSEETASHVGPSQDPLLETNMSSDVEEADPPEPEAPLPSTDSPAALNASDPEDPQTSTDVSQLLPEDPSQAALGSDVSLDTPDPGHDPVNADTMRVPLDTDLSLHPEMTETHKGGGGTAQPQATTSAYQGFPRGATPPIIKPTLPPLSTTPPLPIPIDTALTGVPVCFTFQFGTREPDPPRGDSI